jgi:hypothetical protein
MAKANTNELWAPGLRFDRDPAVIERNCIIVVSSSAVYIAKRQCSYRISGVRSNSVPNVRASLS